MVKYLLKRLLHGLISVVIVVTIVMILIFSLMKRDLIFRTDMQYRKLQENQKMTYKYEQWERYGYLDYISYGEYLNTLVDGGEITKETRDEAAQLGATVSDDSDVTASYVKKFTETYESRGYEVIRSDRTASGQATILFASRDIPIYTRLVKYFAGIFKIDNIHYVERTTGEKLPDTGITFTFFDPVYNRGEDKVFAPAVMGIGTEHRYLLYFDDQFPYIHQNLLKFNIGTSYSVNKGIAITDTMFAGQDPNLDKTVTFATGLTEESPRNLHTATYVKGSKDATAINAARFDDDYTNVSYFKTNMSRTGFSFVIGIISVIAAYLLGVPLGILMARKKNTFIDGLGTVYVIFIIAVPSLAYIFFFREIGGSLGLPKTFTADMPNLLMYVLPIVSLALPSIASLMKWIRRYMIDQENADYVKFARSGGLSEYEIFTKHILKNAIIPIVHGIPGSILGALVGAIITERLYTVPGAGLLLTEAIQSYDNGVVVGLTLFYAVLSILSLILGDILMAAVDPRISFTEKAR